MGDSYGAPLSKPAILREFAEKNIVIYPFPEEGLHIDPQLKTVSYDVRLGAHFYRERKPAVANPLRNPFDKKSVLMSWKKEEAAPWGMISSKYYKKVEDSNIAEDSKVIILEPGENILGHTLEFIGGRGTITTSMHARSSTGRNLVEVCKCAGWGDVGYINRWTMEITNISRYYPIVLEVGQRYAQIAFFKVEAPGETYACKSSKYQQTEDLDELVAKWKPEDMLPKMWRDREVRK